MGQYVPVVSSLAPDALTSARSRAINAADECVSAMGAMSLSRGCATQQSPARRAAHGYFRNGPGARRITR